MLGWLLAAVAVVGGAIAFVAIVRFRPGYDPYGWLVWGHQVLHRYLNTDGAPSWKPLTFLFALPYALFSDRTAVWLWSVTAVAGFLAASVFAARIAYRLTGPSEARPWGRWVAGLFAAVAVPGMTVLVHQVAIANSDPLNTALCLAAIDAHLSRRPRLGFVILVLAALGRPEVWPFAGLDALYLWLRVPGARVLAVAGVALIPAAWFAVPALTSKSWLRPGDLALNQRTVIHGNKLLGVLGRWRALYELPMQIAAVAGVAVAALRRDRVTLGLAGLAVLWVAVEIAFAYHGWSAVERYLMEPGAVMVVIAAGLVGRLIVDSAALPGPLRWAGPALVLVLLGFLVPTVHHRGSAWKTEIAVARQDAVVLNRLHDVVQRLGGGSRIVACGQPVARVQYQSQLAWAVGVNVGEIGYNPGKAIQRGKPIVLFKVYRGGWQVRPLHLAPGTEARCSALRIDGVMG